MKAPEQFYTGVLGVEHDAGRPNSPGMWINVGEVGQIHLFGGTQLSPAAKGPGQDPTLPDVALAVADILETRAELGRLGVPYWHIEGLTSPDSLQVFLDDPCGNMVELHQIDKCNSRASNHAKA